MTSQDKRREVEELLGRNGVSGSSSSSSSSKRARKKRAQEAADLEEERRLTALLFGGGGGGGSSSAGGASSAVNKSYERANLSRSGAGYRRSISAGSKIGRGGTVGDGDPDQSDRPLFEIDRSGDSNVSNSHIKEVGSEEASDEDNDECDQQGDRENDRGSYQNQAAWVDDDDEGLRVNLLESASRLRKLRRSRAEAAPVCGTDLEARLRARFRSTAELTARTDWAQWSDNEVEGDVGGVSADPNRETPGAKESSALSLFEETDRAGQRLPAGFIKMVRCKDANQTDPNQSVVQAVHFHPASDAENPLLLTAGLDKTLRFFQVGEEKSTKVHGIHFPKLPIYSASFLGSTGNVVVSGRRPFFYLYDAASGNLDLVPRIHSGRLDKSLERFATSPDGRTVAFMGNDGYILLFDAMRKHCIADLKMNGSVRALTFTASGDQVLGSGSDGDVYRWDLRKACQCVERFQNQDGTITSYLAASSRHLAVGAESGVVNLYSELNMTAPSTKRTPIKSVLNLRTSADMVRFNPDGQLLALSSRREKNGMKLLHVPSATVFSNWPTSKTPLSYVWSHDFSPESRFVAIGNDKGNCLLYRVTHYANT